MERYLFVIDYQNDFVDGALGFPGAEKLDEKGRINEIARMLGNTSAARKHARELLKELHRD